MDSKHMNNHRCATDSNGVWDDGDVEKWLPSHDEVAGKTHGPPATGIHDSWVRARPGLTTHGPCDKYQIPAYRSKVHIMIMVEMK